MQYIQYNELPTYKFTRLVCWLYGWSVGWSCEKHVLGYYQALLVRIVTTSAITSAVTFATNCAVKVSTTCAVTFAHHIENIAYEDKEWRILPPLLSWMHVKVGMRYDWQIKWFQPPIEDIGGPQCSRYTLRTNYRKFLHFFSYGIQIVEAIIYPPLTLTNNEGKAFISIYSPRWNPPSLLVYLLWLRISYSPYIPLSFVPPLTRVCNPFLAILIRFERRWPSIPPFCRPSIPKRYGG